MEISTARIAANFRLQNDLHLAGAFELHTFLRQRRPGDVEAQLFQPFEVVYLDPHGCAQTEAVDVSSRGRPGVVPHGIASSKVSIFCPARGSKVDRRARRRTRLGRMHCFAFLLYGALTCAAIFVIWKLQAKMRCATAVDRRPDGR